MSSPLDAPLCAGLARALRAEIEGALVQDVQVAGEDLLVLTLRLARGNDLGRMRSLGLSILPEAAGPLFLRERVRRDAEASVTLLHLLEAARATLRGSVLTTIEAPPSERLVIFRFLRAAEEAELLLLLFGPRPNAVVARDGLVVADARGRIAAGVEARSLVRSDSKDPRHDVEPEPQVDLGAWSEGLEQAREAVLLRARFQVARRRLAQALTRAEALVVKREQDAERLRAPVELRHAADALASYLHLVRRGMVSIEAPGFGSGGDSLVVALDPALDPARNLEAAYSRAAKAERGQAEALSRLAAARVRRVELSELAARAAATTLSAQESSPQDALNELCDAMEAVLPRPTRARQTEQRQAVSLPYRRFVSKDGHDILVGKSATANAKLTFGLAHGKDLWLHARGVPGSHVVVKLPKGAEVPNETLLDAATLAHHYSSRGEERSGEVTWAYVKDVSRRRGMAPGAVLVARERVIGLKLEPERLARLISPGPMEQ